jgi:hypothetical protein
MTLELAGDEVEVVRAALAEYAGGLREKAHHHCINYSPIGIDLCRTRIRVEALMERLSHPLADPSNGNARVAGELRAVSEAPKRPA